MLFRRLLGWALVAVALALFGPEMLVTLQQGSYCPLNLSDFWHHFDPQGLSGVKHLANNPVFFWVWDPVLKYLLRLPALLLPSLAGFYLLITGRKGDRKYLKY